MVKKYRVRIINYPRIGEKRWCRFGSTDSGGSYRITTKDINEAHRFREQKQRTSSRSEYVYQVEEWNGRDDADLPF